MCEMSWTAAMSNPEAFGINDDTGGAPVHIYARAAVLSGQAAPAGPHRE